jgi:hypothetical protein
MEFAILPDLPNAPQVLVTIENARKRGIPTTRFIQRDLITRGIFTSKADLARKIARYIKVHNKSAKPFKWTSEIPTVGFFVPAPFELSPPERHELKRISRSQSRRADDVRRVWIILGLAGRQTLAAVSRSQSCNVNTVKLWRDRFLKARIIDWTLNHKPADGSTHW